MPLEILKHGSVKTGVKLLLLCGLAAGLAACGQRGPLLPPPAKTTAPAEAPAAEEPDEGFILDPLL